MAILLFCFKVAIVGRIHRCLIIDYVGLSNYNQMERLVAFTAEQLH